MNTGLLIIALVLTIIALAVVAWLWGHAKGRREAGAEEAARRDAARAAAVPIRAKGEEQQAQARQETEARRSREPSPGEVKAALARIRGRPR